MDPMIIFCNAKSPFTASYILIISVVCIENASHCLSRAFVCFFSEAHFIVKSLYSIVLNIDPIVLNIAGTVEYNRISMGL